MMLKNNLRRFISSIDSCGQETQRWLQLTGCAKEEACSRSYYLYVPTSRCDAVDNDVVPLVFALHCFGCSYKQMSHWQSIAEDFSFVLVIPEGIQHSWNARYCCGYALEHNLNDVGFLQSIIEELSSEFSFVSRDVAYAVGWSNGGYMSAYAANLFRAVAPIAGHDYDPSVSKPTSLFMHHSSDDPNVSIMGCCSDTSMPNCCCGISKQADQCTSAMQVFETWATEINRCSGGTQVSLEDQTSGITCHTGVDCMANTTFCVHRGSGHFNRPSFGKAFPMTKEVADFFARDACSINGGTWSEQLRKCSCDGVKAGTFCLAPGLESFEPLESHQVGAVGSAPIVGTGLVLLLGLIVLMRSKMKYGGWSRLPTSDVEMSSVR